MPPVGMILRMNYIKPGAWMRRQSSTSNGRISPFRWYIQNRTYYRPGRPYRGRHLYKRIDEALMNNPWLACKRQVDWLGSKNMRNTIPDPPIPFKSKIEDVEEFLLQNSSFGSRACICLYMNRWSRENSLTLSMVERFQELIFKYSGNHIYSSVLWTTTGENLCTGSDLHTIYELIKKQDLDSVRKYYRALQQTVYYLATTKKPFLAFMTGDVIGTGAGLALNAMLPITTESTRICAPGCAVGLSGCEAGLSYRFSRLPHHIGEYLLVSGRSIVDADLVHLGLSDFFIPSDRGQILESKLSELNNASIEEVSQGVLLLSDHPDNSRILTVTDAIERCFSKSTVPEIMQALRNETEHIEWAQNTLKCMQRNSPLSMEITLRATRLARYLPLDHCLHMEYAIAARLIQSAEFNEGITAFIEGRSPQWKEDLKIDLALVESYLEPLKGSEQLILTPTSPEATRVTRIRQRVLDPSPSLDSEEVTLDPDEWGGPFAECEAVMKVAQQKLLSEAGTMVYHSLLNREEQIFDVIQTLKHENMAVVNHTSSN